MRSSGTALRKAYQTALNGHLTIGSEAIPVVDEKLDEGLTEKNIYVAMATQQDNERSNKTTWVEEVFLALVIVQRTGSTVSKDVIESIEDQILQLVLPSKGNHGLHIDAPFRITYVRKENSSTVAAKLDNGEFVIAKQVNFKNRITQSS